MNAGKDIVVVKYGSTTVTNEKGMDTEKLRLYVPQIARLALDNEVAMVSSGSTLTGQALRNGKEALSRRANYAAVGSAKSFVAWQDELAGKGIDSAQVPVTNHEIDSAEGYMLRQSLLSLMGDGIMPIANGNDVLSDEGMEDLAIGTDNDRLAAHIAKLLGAKHLIILTDEQGVLDRADQVVPNVGTGNINRVRGLVKDSGNGIGGDMGSKINVCYEVSSKPVGIFAHIAHAGAELLAVLDGQVGTHFAPHS